MAATVETYKKGILAKLNDRYDKLDDYLEKHPYAAKSDRLYSQMIELEKIIHAVESGCLEKLDHI